MLKNIISEIISALEKNGINNVYSAFDAMPIAYKKHDIFIVIALDGFESMTPIYSQYNVFIPFKAEISLSITAPTDASAEKLYDYFDEQILPVFRDITTLMCSLKKVNVKFDSNINRLVLKTTFSASGINRIERSDVN